MMHILFVDDDANVLQAIRRTMHGMRAEWHMEFASSGVAALGALALSQADVIVSDMRMPGMDGWQLLTEVKKLYPQTVRLILSGQADSASIMRSIGVAQQYLAKPCETATLKAAIAQTRALRDLLNSDRLAALVGAVGTLPSAPAAFQELLTCLQQPTPSVAEAARIIGRDVAMTANVLKLVNSAFFGARQTISRVDRAVAYLGLDTLGALVVGHSVFKGGATNCIAGFSLDRLWQHCLDTATLARAIARQEKMSVARSEEAFLAGILHDVGKVVYATRSKASHGAIAYHDDDLAQMQAHHAEVGAYLLGLWGFPNTIVEAVAFHHAPSRGSCDGLSVAGLVHIADRLVHQHDAPGAIPNDLGIEPGFLEKLNLPDHVPLWSAEFYTSNSEHASP